METKTCPDWIDNDPNVPVLPGEPARWSGPANPPAIGDQVNVRMNGFGLGEVVAYEVVDGYLGLKVRPEKRPDWHIKQKPGRNVILVFGVDLAGRTPVAEVPR